MGSSRGTDRVTTVVAAICIGAALTGPMIAFADPDSDSPSRQSDSSNDANSALPPTFLGSRAPDLRRARPAPDLRRACSAHAIPPRRNRPGARGVLATRQLPAARMTRPTRPTAVVPVPVSVMVDPEIPAARMTPLTRPTVVVPVPVSVMVDPARSAHPIPTHRGRPRARGVLSTTPNSGGTTNEPSDSVVPVPVSVMVDPARSTHPYRPIGIPRERGEF